MFRTGDKVVYGVHGVCSVVNVEEKTIDRKQVSYLVLEPIHQSGTRYLVPAHNSAAMAKLHRVLTKEELEALLASDVVHSDAWIADENRRKQIFRELLNGGDRTRLMQMIHTLYRHKTEQSASGRKIHLCDENFLRDAEKLLLSEISLVMELSPEEARKYIRSKLKEDA